MDVTLETRRLILRQPRPEDAPRTARLLNNFAVSGKLSRVPYPYKLSDAEWWISRWRADKPAGETNFFIELPGEGLIGNCGLHPESGTTVIGYYLGEPYWNRGFMSEAAAAVIAWYFDVTGAAQVGSGAFAFNKASLAVQKKLGFTEIGTSTLHCLARQEDLRHIDTRLTRARWDERRAGASAKETT
jgi:RimJ/RimL family protein N-acetyltransferase